MLMFLAATAGAARPHYGGVLRIETVGAVRVVDPAMQATDAAEATVRARLIPLIFESLAAISVDGGLRPVLALSWEHDDRGVRWRFRLRPSVKLHNGSTLQAPQVAAVLGAREPAWKAGSAGDVVVIETDRPHPDLPWELADPRFAIVVRTAGGDLIGSGPFRIDRMEPRRLALRAFEDHWAGRPFIDAVQIDQGRSLTDQLSSIELGRADVVAIRQTDLRRVVQRGLRTAASQPIELIALVFEPHRSGPIDEPVRNIVAASIDRSALATILLQRQGEPAVGLLPSWLSGYAAAFVTHSPPAVPRTAAGTVPLERRTFVLRVDTSDTVAQEIAARVSVDAREAGVTIVVQAPSGLAPRPDARLVRIKLDATTPDRVLSAALTRFGPRVEALAPAGPVAAADTSVGSVLNVERALLEHAVIVPLVHVRELYAIGERVESWSGPVVLGSGALNFSTVWIRPEPATARPRQ
jgi:MarR-like DNA-binding transcriptional regulator SgrR of sgrS sRNA